MLNRIARRLRSPGGVLACAAAVLAAGAITVAVWPDDPANRADTLSSVAGPTTTPEPTLTADPRPSTVPTPLATSLSPTPTTATALHTSTTRTSSATLPARCVGPLPEGGRADPECDALHPHEGLPEPCLGLRYACAWPDAHGATPAGPYTGGAVVRGSSIHVTFGTTPEDLAGGANAGPVREFVIRLAPRASDTVLATRRLQTSASATDFLDVPPGAYDVLVQELNDSGLSAGFVSAVDIAGAPSPSASPRPTTPPSPSATSAPTPEPTASPSGA